MYFLAAVDTTETVMTEKAIILRLEEIWIREKSHLTHLQELINWARDWIFVVSDVTKQHAGVTKQHAAYH